MEIKPNKRYRTRNGLQARIYATDAGGSYPIHGAVLYGKHWIPKSWTQEGRMHSFGGREHHDLMAEWEAEKSPTARAIHPEVKTQRGIR